MEKNALKVIAVDFDGCLVDNQYPFIGKPIWKNINKLKEEMDKGAKIILWTCRIGQHLDAAVNFCKEQGIHLDAVNDNLPEVVEAFSESNCRKIFANEYWDDHAVWMSEYDISDFSDGYHTFNDLYKQRLYLSAALFNTYRGRCWKSKKHADGELCFGGGWFIVGIETPMGPFAYHYQNQYWDIFNVKELDKAPEWDGHTEKDIYRLDSLLEEDKKICCEPAGEWKQLKDLPLLYRILDKFGLIGGYIFREIRVMFRIFKDVFRKSTMQSWAEREIKIACKYEREGNDTPEDDWDYGCACYESAFKAYKSLCKDGHSGFSIGMTKHILNRLIDCKPLTPIFDTPDVWNNISDISGLKGEEVNYQCKRMSGLFKYVYADGSVKYCDIDAYCSIDIDSGSTYHSGLVQRIMDEMFPITMPYMPGEPIKVYCQDLLTDRKNGDFDTRAIRYAIKPNGDKINIDRFFKESDSETGWAEITFDEYEKRREIHIDRLWRENPELKKIWKDDPTDPNTKIPVLNWEHNNKVERILGQATVEECDGGLSVYVKTDGVCKNEK